MLWKEFCENECFPKWQKPVSSAIAPEWTAVQFRFVWRCLLRLLEKRSWLAFTWTSRRPCFLDNWKGSENWILMELQFSPLSSVHCQTVCREQLSQRSSVNYSSYFNKKPGVDKIENAIKEKRTPPSAGQTEDGRCCTEIYKHNTTQTLKPATLFQQRTECWCFVRSVLRLPAAARHNNADDKMEIILFGELNTWKILKL